MYRHCYRYCQFLLFPLFFFYFLFLLKLFLPFAGSQLNLTFIFLTLLFLNSNALSNYAVTCTQLKEMMVKNWNPNTNKEKIQNKIRDVNKHTVNGRFGFYVFFFVYFVFCFLLGRFNFAGMSYNEQYLYRIRSGICLCR